MAEEPKTFNMLEQYQQTELARLNKNTKLATIEQMIAWLNDENPEDKFRVNSKYIYEMMQHDARELYDYDRPDIRRDARALLDLLFKRYTSIGMDSLIAELYYLRNVGRFEPLSSGGRGGGRGYVAHKKGKKEDIDRAEKFNDLWEEAIFRRGEIVDPGYTMPFEDEE